VRGRRRGGGASRRRGRHRHHRAARRRAGYRPDRPILDPEKSIFVAFAPTADGTAPPYEPGRFGWECLRTADVAAAAEFYAATFGWQVTVGEGGGVVDACGLRVAELVPDAATSGWLPFVRVERLAEACDRIVARGGAAEEPVLWAGTAGYALVRDPQGVAFAVHAQ
jgi:predicted enzyme related to lactoylglutathione lyase